MNGIEKGPFVEDARAAETQMFSALMLASEKQAVDASSESHHERATIASGSSTGKGADIGTRV
jgi:hypothetical protein